MEKSRCVYWNNDGGPTRKAVCEIEGITDPAIPRTPWAGLPAYVLTKLIKAGVKPCIQTKGTK